MDSVLEKWVETNVAPDRIIASKAGMTRPLCPHPQVAKYNGTGNANDAARSLHQKIRIQNQESEDGKVDTNRNEEGLGALRLEVRIVAGQRAILRVEGDSTLEVGDGFCVLVALRMGDRKHVDRMVVVRILVANQTQMRDRLIVLAAVDGQGRGIEALVDRLRRRFTLSCLALADVEVQAYAFVQFLFLGVLAKDRLEEICGLLVRMPLERFKSALINGDCLEIGRPTLWGRRWSWRGRPWRRWR